MAGPKFTGLLRTSTYAVFVCGSGVLTLPAFQGRSSVEPVAQTNPAQSQGSAEERISAADLLAARRWLIDPFGSRVVNRIRNTQRRNYYPDTFQVQLNPNQMEWWDSKIPLGFGFCLSTDNDRDGGWEIRVRQTVSRAQRVYVFGAAFAATLCDDNFPNVRGIIGSVEFRLTSPRREVLPITAEFDGAFYRGNDPRKQATREAALEMLCRTEGMPLSSDDLPPLTALVERSFGKPQPYLLSPCQPPQQAVKTTVGVLAPQADSAQLAMWLRVKKELTSPNGTHYFATGMQGADVPSVVRRK